MNLQYKTSRKAVTLLELMLVLAILVALLGVAIPSFESMVSSRRLHQSVEKLQNDILEARVKAMRTGQAQVLKATLQGPEYSIEPWLGGTELQDASSGATVMATSGQIVKTEETTGGSAESEEEASSDIKKLSEGITFSRVETLVDSRNALAMQQSGETVNVNAQANASGLSSPILLYPDGSSTTGQIILIDTRGRRMAIQIRGVTGQLSVLRLVSETPAATP